MRQMSNERILTAWCNGIPIGEVRDENGVWSFEYRRGWLVHERRFALAPTLPLKEGRQTDSSTVRPVQWFFDNLLPEEAQRTLLANEARVDLSDAWGLLAYYGAESAGAITLLPPGVVEVAGRRQSLSPEQLQQRILTLPQQPLTAKAPKHMSLGGAQHKLAVILERESDQWQLYEPVGSAPSTHILKPEDRSTVWRHTAINEFFCMRLAERIGLPVPSTYFLKVPESVYLVQRFDRRVVNGQVMRRHIVDGLQLCGLSRTLKYEKATIETLSKMIDVTTTKAKARLEIFRWIVFNVLIGNGDAHMKNLSFYADADGYSLAPFYDLVSTVVYDAPEYRDDHPYWPHSELTMNIGSTRRYRELTRNDFIAAGATLGLNERAVTTTIAMLVSAVAKHMDAVRREVESIAKPDAGETRMLNAIFQLPLREMLDKLQRF